ncbi:enoyl-CoA hydratase/isomerase family protein [Fodinibius sediminis]|uniref:Enoyl-CoA hydratase n=1 Tax=Fodinibius sediminis TaxID=1214077 RepID=A0A521AIB0_9BACT|nr:enoyl-CoA hydratase/isomerase family protein [Fodinibius sediminis]SMO34491.1 enoyl-CoA hydratase [Fodinibius sediminis]
MNNLKVEYKNKTCHAIVNRPGTHNAINFQIMRELEGLLGDLESDQTTRCLILSGAGSKTFISGGDLREFHRLKSAEEARAMASRMLSILTRIEKLPCWTIAGINGSTFGGGWETMLAFDFRMAAEQATFCFTQAQFYLPPGWGGLTRLVERVGRSTALQWLAEAKQINARKALRCNLIDRIVDSNNLLPEARAWAEKLGRHDRAFIRDLKEGALRAAPARWEAIEAETDAFARWWEDERHRLQVKNFLEDRL